MPCKNCENHPVVNLTNNNVKLCKNHFIRYFERKVMKTISLFNLVSPGDVIGVGLSGGKDSLTLLYILSLVQRKKPINVEALLIDEGIKGYRNKTILDAKRFCEENQVKLNIVSYKEEFGYTLDEMLKILKLKPCSVCGVLRRYLLNKKAKDFTYSKLATGHNMDDEIQSILMNQFRSNVETSSRLGPMTGVVDDPRFIRRIKPLYFVSEKEVAIYTYLKGFVSEFTECPNSQNSYRNDVRDFVNKFEEKYPGTKHSIINSFMQVLPLLKKYFSAGEIQSCMRCGEPSSKKICQACNILERLKIKVSARQ